MQRGRPIFTAIHFLQQEHQSLLLAIALAGHCDIWFHARQC